MVTDKPQPHLKETFQAAMMQFIKYVADSLQMNWTKWVKAAESHKLLQTHLLWMQHEFLSNCLMT